jgi:hypothetical protein
MKAVCHKHQQAYEVNQGCPYCPALVLPTVRRSLTVTPAVLADLFDPVENRGYRVHRIWMNAHDYADVRKFGRDVLDVETRPEKVRQGIVGYIWGAEIRVTRKVPINHAVIVGSDEGSGDLDPLWVPEASRVIRIVG